MSGNIMEYNGGAVVAMVGKDCVAIASDKRFGLQLLTLATDFEKIFKMNDRCYIGLAGLATDVQTLSEELKLKCDLYKLREEREITPKKFAHLVSSTLYDHRWGPYFCEPCIAGIDENNKPFICSTDLIGCINFAKDFVVCGTTARELYGICESFWEPDLGPEELFEVISQSLLNAFDRDSQSGWGAVVHVITPEKIITRHLKTRQD